MTDDIALFHGKMMIGHDGLLSGMSVGRALLYQKIPSCPLFVSGGAVASRIYPSMTPIPPLFNKILYKFLFVIKVSETKDAMIR
jgi:hypothetical protein